jgi:hypothetical protein
MNPGRKKLSFNDRIRWATAPVQRRSLALLWGGFALFAASGGVSMLVGLPEPLLLLLYVGMLAGWVSAAAGMVGYVRCLFGLAAAEMRKVQSERMKD